MQTIRANPKFIKSVPVSVRRKWSDALYKAYINPKIGQSRGQMLRGNQHKTLMCCLMVGHEAFGGDDSTRDRDTPNQSSPFTKALGYYHLSNPIIGIGDNGNNYTASDCNDKLELDFLQIASLIYSPSGYYPPIHIA